MPFSPSPSNGGTSGRRRLESSLPAWENETIEQIAEQEGIDARFLAAVRVAENGGPGREFGVLSVPAPTYEDQARVAAVSIRNNITRYENATGFGAAADDGRLTREFIDFMAARWAPTGAENDPNGLNANWPGNVARAYSRSEFA